MSQVEAGLLTEKPSSYIPEMVETLFYHEDLRLADIKHGLMISHIELGGSPLGFLASGTFITEQSEENQKISRHLPREQAFPQMRPDCMEYLSMAEQARRDKIKISQLLEVLLRPCKTTQDVRDALPDCMRDCFPPIQGMPRTREAGWTLRDKPILRFQFVWLEDVALHYIANRMLY